MTFSSASNIVMGGGAGGGGGGGTSTRNSPQKAKRFKSFVRDLALALDLALEVFKDPLIDSC